MKRTNYLRSLSTMMALIFSTTGCMIHKDIMDLAPKTKDKDQFEIYPEDEFMKIRFNEKIEVTTADRDFQVFFREVKSDTLIAMVWRQPVTREVLKGNEQYLIRIPLGEIQKVEVWRENHFFWIAASIVLVGGTYFAIKNMTLNFSPW